ncbi:MULTISPECIES: protein-export chaperone SecB [unclassified Variovorax]|uniref:protein-export chaperone SecB n=1 Tax=unclassified Variovorax TaxID=663243 RepID=UPI001318462D|nr:MULTISPECIES: protein-export chaperone SecB [unclassified Variovorax]VTU41658.1 Protein-export protein SecB [Variovorax sp. SRS16]VTU41695.1 Protein-export protein SecB [Variovorax sp. PBL-E5]VTU44723.1 Protein-export protein SecB [Variovorax sp. PBL-H6]
MTQPTLNLHAILTRTSRLETKKLPQEAVGKFEFDVNIANTWRALAEKNRYAASVALTLKGRVEGAEVLTGEYVVEGIVEIVDHDEASKQHILAIWVPNQLVPYIRELLSSSTSRSGFPTILLPPVVFQPPTIIPERAMLPGSPKQLH